MNFFEIFIRNHDRRTFLKWAGAFAVAACGLRGRSRAEAGPGQVVDETPDEIFLHGSGLYIPH